MEKFSINSVVMAHRTGVVHPQEPIVCIHVLVLIVQKFRSCSWLISVEITSSSLEKEVRADVKFGSQDSNFLYRIHLFEGITE